MTNQRHQNSFDFIRFVLASAVLVSHHYSLSGYLAPSIPLVDVSLGRAAVFAFFAVSGFLMYNSLSRTQDFYFYFTSRLVRIVPNLVFAVVTTSFVLMVVFNNYTNVLSHLYYIRKDALSFIAPPYYWIEGIFTDRPDRGVNGSLWTLQYEFFMYIVIYMIFLLPARLLGVALIVIVILVSQPFVQNVKQGVRIATFHLQIGYLAQTGFHFLAGALIARYWQHLNAHKFFISIAACALIAALGIFAPEQKSWMFFFAWIPFFIFCLSPFASWFGKYGDPSYGVYIFAFPIQQAAIMLIPSFWVSMIFSFVFTTVIGYACWHGFEQNFLAKRKSLALYLANVGKKITGRNAIVGRGPH